MDEITPQDNQEAPTTEIQDPNKLLFSLLKEHNLSLEVKALSEENPFIGDGFVLTDKPLLIVGAKYKEAVSGI